METASAPAPVRPAPIIDVAPPATRLAGANAPAPVTKPVTATAQSRPADKTKQNKPAAVPKPAKPKSSTNTAIIVALMVFLALSGVAIYAYTKSNK